jgi:deoxyribodipyrimidine photo-lyase
MQFPTDYQSILERIEQVDPVQYSKTRNFTNGLVTYLSPYLSRGVISLLQIKNHILTKSYKRYQTEKLLQELAWREYFQRVWQAKSNDLWNDLKQEQADVHHHEMIDSLVTASTGITVIDDHIRLLYKTGYMHNHVRMYTASIACNIGKAHWQNPSNWMYYHLLDGDIASNICSWQWVAGAFASKKYYCNQENINKYTQSKQTGTFLDYTYEQMITANVPDQLQQTTALHLTTILPVTDQPLIDINKPTFIYNSYNLDPLWRKEEDANRVLLLEPSHFQQFPVSSKVIQFIVSLSENIPGIKIFTGELDAIIHQYRESPNFSDRSIVSKEHPAFSHYPGIKDSREWMHPAVNGYYSSFFAYWKKCEKYL